MAGKAYWQVTRVGSTGLLLGVHQKAEARQLAEEVLPTARTAYELASRGFALGKFGYLDVLDAQRTWSEARSQYLDQLLATHRAAADIDRLLGTEAGL